MVINPVCVPFYFKRVSKFFVSHKILQSWLLRDFFRCLSIGVVVYWRANMKIVGREKIFREDEQFN